MENKGLKDENLEAAACILVVALHSSAIYLNNYLVVRRGIWLRANLIDSLKNILKL